MKILAVEKEKQIAQQSTHIEVLNSSLQRQLLTQHLFLGKDVLVFNEMSVSYL